MLLRFCSSIAFVVNCRLVLGSEEPGVFLAALVPVLHARLATAVIVESSEEIRLLLVKRINELVLVCQDKTSPFIQELSEIIQRTLHDPFPDVKKVLFLINCCRKLVL
jgi:hypothetical protein